MRYRKKPVVIEALQFTDEAKQQCFNFVGGNRRADFEDVGDDMGIPILVFDTIHGDEAVARFGDWLVKEPDGIYCYPCKPDIFADTYEGAGAPLAVFLDCDFLNMDLWEEAEFPAGGKTLHLKRDLDTNLVTVTVLPFLVEHKFTPYRLEDRK